MKKVIDIVKEEHKPPQPEGLPPELATEPFDMLKELEKAAAAAANDHSSSGIPLLDDAFKKAFKYRPKKK